MTTTIPQQVEISELRGKIDFGIITFREDEFMAVLKRIQPKWIAFGNWHYNVAEIAVGKQLYYAAIVRTYEQGQSDTQQVANYLINELEPSCLVLVGIAGGKPENEFTLGDVVVATRLHDFSQRASLPEGRRELTNLGGPPHPIVRAAAANLCAVEGLIGDWNSERAIGVPRPPVLLDDKNFTGTDDDWKDKVKDKLSIYFGPTGKDRQPIVTAAAVAAGNVLMKDPEELQEWLDHTRDLKAVEMELPGAYAAAGGRVPVLAIRGFLCSRLEVSAMWWGSSVSRVGRNMRAIARRHSRALISLPVN